MSSIQANTTSSNLPASSTPSDSPVSRSSSEKTDCSVPNPAGTERSGDAAQLLLSAVQDVRQIIRLVQCRICNKILEAPTTLPCGQSLCQRCIPDTHIRTNISWPATESRMRGFQCPFTDCAKEHAVGDCGVDVTLNKALELIQSVIEQDRDVTGLSDLSTMITVQDPWEIAGLSSMEQKTKPATFKGSKIVATYTMAALGQLQFHNEVSYSALGAGDDTAGQIDVALLARLKQLVRTEVDCQVCYAIYLDPLTSSCGHTFCRGCVQRLLDHSSLCPMCRRDLSIQAQATAHTIPSNQRLSGIINGFWADLVALRAQAYRLEQQSHHGGFDIPLFVCAPAFPHMPMFLHVFEPRYRLMIRRAMEGNRTFGMVVHNANPNAGHPNYHEYGTLLRIQNIEFFHDGRSLLETVGVSRFRVTRSGMMDGYSVGDIEKIDDMNLADEEAFEARETMRAHGIQRFAPAPDGTATGQAQAPISPPVPISLDDLDNMSTRELTEFGVDFVHRMQARSVSWLVPRIMSVYGECPNDPALFPWWFGSILPVTEAEKYRLLSTTSVRERLKICCQWIEEWEASRWNLTDCLVL